jgi:hypothetical protein
MNPIRPIKDRTRSSDPEKNRKKRIKKTRRVPYPTPKK